MTVQKVTLCFGHQLRALSNHLIRQMRVKGSVLFYSTIVRYCFSRDLIKCQSGLFASVGVGLTIVPVSQAKKNRPLIKNGLSNVIYINLLVH
jgi:hypothetical protein